MTKVFNETNIQKVVDFVVQEKPNHLFLYTTNFLTEFLERVPYVDHKIEILTLYYITPEVVKLQKEKNIAMIRSTYGETTIGQAILLKNVPKDVDIDNYEINNLGPAIDDDFYHLRIENDILEVSIPTLGRDWKSTGDNFTLVNNNYYFHGRSDLYRIGYTWIKYKTLEDEVNAYFGINNGKSNATAVIDKDMQKLYLAVWAPASDQLDKFINFLKEKYDGLTPSYVIADQPYENFLGPRKVDQEQIRNYCRRQLDLDKDIL